MRKLAKFFREARPVQIPVRLTRTIEEGPCTETTMVEYETPREPLFTSNLRLQFADKLRIENADGTRNIEALVVVLQHHFGRTAVAARFDTQDGTWNVKP
jgi:hypothetical protein